MPDLRCVARRLSAVLVIAAAVWAPAATRADDEPVPAVVASIAPVHSLLSGVMRGIAAPRLLVPGGVSPHDWQLRPSDAKALSRAAAVFWIGPGLEGFLVKPMTALAKTVFTVELAHAEGIQARPLATGGGNDPHLWLDPRNAAAMVRTMVVVMANIDPGRAVRYRKNGSAVLLELGRLERDLHATLAPVRRAPFLTFHDAYGYFAHRFGLRLMGAVAAEAERPPGAKRVKELRRMITGGEVVCVFTEPQIHPALATTLIAGTRARTGALDPLGAALAPGPGLYGALMREMGTSLVACLGGVR